jgi:divalent metal cation (Fe/Co/Zn/Cd) transporter
MAFWLVAVTILYNLAEAAVALWAGLQADSIALIGFGLDSVIEVAAAVVVFIRVKAESRVQVGTRIARMERRVERFVGATFIVLALYVAGHSIWILQIRQAPSESPIGIILAVISLIIMPLVAWGKMRAARSIGSRALNAEARETLACSYLSLCLLMGLLANVTLGWWWADPVAALFMVPWLAREGVGGLRGED